MTLVVVQAHLLRRGAWLTVQWQNARWEVAIVSPSSSCGGFGNGLDIEDALAKALRDFDAELVKKTAAKRVAT